MKNNGDGKVNRRIAHTEAWVQEDSSNSCSRSDEELVLFHDMRRQQRMNFLLHPSNDDIELALSSKYGGLTGFHMVPASTPPWRPRGSDLLALDPEKNDYSWLVTPPATPLFPNLDKESPNKKPWRTQNNILKLSKFPGTNAREMRNPTVEMHNKNSHKNPSPHKSSTAYSTNVDVKSRTSAHLPRRQSPKHRPSQPMARESCTVLHTASRRPSTPTLKRSNLPPSAMSSSLDGNLHTASRRSSTPTLKRSNLPPSAMSSSLDGNLVSKGRIRGASLSPRKVYRSSEVDLNSEPPSNLRTSISNYPREDINVTSRHGASGVRRHTSSETLSSSTSSSRVFSSSGSQSWSSKTSILSSSDISIVDHSYLASQRNTATPNFQRRITKSPLKRQIRSTDTSTHVEALRNVTARKSLELSMEQAVKYGSSEDILQPTAHDGPQSSAGTAMSQASTTSTVSSAAMTYINKERNENVGANIQLLEELVKRTRARLRENPESGYKVCQGYLKIDHDNCEREDGKFSSHYKTSSDEIFVDIQEDLSAQFNDKKQQKLPHFEMHRSHLLDASLKVQHQDNGYTGSRSLCSLDQETLKKHETFSDLYNSLKLQQSHLVDPIMISDPASEGNVKDYFIDIPEVKPRSNIVTRSESKSLPNAESHTDIVSEKIIAIIQSDSIAVNRISSRDAKDETKEFLAHISPTDGWHAHSKQESVIRVVNRTSKNYSPSDSAFSSLERMYEPGKNQKQHDFEDSQHQASDESLACCPSAPVQSFSAQDQSRNAIIFCSSIIHDIVYRAASLAVDKEELAARYNMEESVTKTEDGYKKHELKLIRPDQKHVDGDQQNEKGTLIIIDKNLSMTVPPTPVEADKEPAVADGMSSNGKAFANADKEVASSNCQCRIM